MPPGERVREADACGAFGCTASGPFYRVRHPSKGERVVCAAHARRLAEPVADGGIKSSRGDVSSSTVAPLEAIPFEKGPGAIPTRPPCLRSMKASEPTPAEGQSGSGRTESQKQRALLRVLTGNADVIRDYATVSPDDSPEEIVRELREAAALSDALADVVEQTFLSEAGDGGATDE